MNDTEATFQDVYDYLNVCLTIFPHASLSTRLQQALKQYSVAATSAPPTLTLPLIACRAAGGNAKNAVPVAAAWFAVFLAARLLDDVEDGDAQRWMEPNEDTAPIINLGIAFLLLAQHILLTDPHLSSSLRPALLQRFNQVMLTMASSQHLDLQPGGISDLTSYWTHIRGKSGAFVGLGVETGAACAGIAADALTRYYQFGFHTGILLQIINDYNGFFIESERDDLEDGKLTLPFWYLLEHTSAASQQTLIRLWRDARDHPQAREDLRQFARDRGADFYLIAEIMRHEARARQSLTVQDDPHRLLGAYLDYLISLLPVHLVH